MEEETVEYWRDQYHALRDSLIHFYSTASGTRWQQCRVCGASNAAIRLLSHSDECPLWREVPTTPSLRSGAMS